MAPAASARVVASWSSRSSVGQVDISARRCAGRDSCPGQSRSSRSYSIPASMRQPNNSDRKKSLELRTPDVHGLRLRVEEAGVQAAGRVSQRLPVLSQGRASRTLQTPPAGPPRKGSRQQLVQNLHLWFTMGLHCLFRGSTFETLEGTRGASPSVLWPVSLIPCLIGRLLQRSGVSSRACCNVALQSISFGLEVDFPGVGLSALVYVRMTVHVLETTHASVCTRCCGWGFV